LDKETCAGRNSLIIKSLFYIIIYLFYMGTIAYSDNSDNNALIHKAKQVTIIIDPGHGGQDNGAQGPSGTLEKDVCLKLAEMLQEELSQDFRVILTRNNDYNMTVYERTSVANSKKGDLFLSLHFGGGYQSQTNYIFISYYKNDSSIESQNLSQTQTHPASRKDWDHVYLKHLTESKKSADKIKQGFDLSTTLQTQKRGYPALILRGADMPALLIEAGYLTDSAKENDIISNRYLQVISTGITTGIKNLFKNLK